jgi:hypothetical protein
MFSCELVLVASGRGNIEASNDYEYLDECSNLLPSSKIQALFVLSLLYQTNLLSDSGDTNKTKDKVFKHRFTKGQNVLFTGSRGLFMFALNDKNFQVCFQSPNK